MDVWNRSWQEEDGGIKKLRLGLATLTEKYFHRTLVDSRRMRMKHGEDAEAMQLNATEIPESGRKMRQVKPRAVGKGGGEDAPRWRSELQVNARLDESGFVSNSIHLRFCAACPQSRNGRRELSVVLLNHNQSAPPPSPPSVFVSVSLLLSSPPSLANDWVKALNQRSSTAKNQNLGGGGGN